MTNRRCLRYNTIRQWGFVSYAQGCPKPPVKFHSQGGEVMTRKTSERRKLKFSGKTLAKTVGVLAVCVYVVFTLVNQRVTLSKQHHTILEEQQKIAEATVEQQKLEDEYKKAGTDEYLESIAREKLGLVKANERVFIDITQN